MHAHVKMWSFVKWRHGIAVEEDRMEQDGKEEEEEDDLNMK